MDAQQRLHLPQDKPKSFVVFLGGTLAGLVVFLPIIVAALALERVTWLLAGSAGLAIVWLAAAFMCLLFTARLAAGDYRHLEPRRWRDQVW